MLLRKQVFGVFDSLPPPLSSIVSIWHDPPLVLCKIFEFGALITQHTDFANNIKMYYIVHFSEIKPVNIHLGYL